MRRIVFTAFASLFIISAFAQTDSVFRSDTTVYTTTVQRPPVRKIGAHTRANDNFLLQLGYTRWNGKPDSIRTKGLSRSFNLYLMFDFPIKTNPHFSVALGPGIATDNMYFDKTYIGIKDNATTVRFEDVSDTSHFKKYKLNTAYLEAPVELRYRFNAEDDRKTVKLAIAAKIGRLVNAHVKGVELQNSANNTINDYTMKENSKKFFNKTRLSLMARAGYSNFTIFASYSITPVFREGVAPTVRPFSVGLSISGL